MADLTKSPAVQAYNTHKARRRSPGRDALEQGLEDTFRASGTVSAAQSSVASTIDGYIRNDRVDAPLVDEALRSTGELDAIDHQEGFHSLRQDALRLSDQASEVASGAVAAGKAEAKSVLQSVEEIVKERPLTAVGIVAAVAWFWGATR